VFLTEPERSDYDLRWHMFGIPVRVHPMFWVMSAILGLSAAVQRGVEYLLVWMACVFVSILVHELGHVFMGRFFGREGSIVLYSFGGLAIGSNALASRWQRIAVSFAGPLAGFLFLAFIFLTMRVVAPETYNLYARALMPIFATEGPVNAEVSPLVRAVIVDLFLINVFWGLLNLLPIWPLDGGQISRDFLGWLSPQKGDRLALGISLVVSGLLAVQALTAYYDRPLIPFLWMVSGIFLAIMFALLAFGSFEQLQQLDQKPWREEWPSRWDRD
jgi:Zn-dependent protease